MAVETFARCGAKVALNHLRDDARGPEQVARLAAQRLYARHGFTRSHMLVLR